MSRTLYIMPSGKFPTNASGEPMLIEQFQFEECCCDVTPNDVYIDFISRIYRWDNIYGTGYAWRAVGGAPATASWYLTYWRKLGSPVCSIVSGDIWEVSISYFSSFYGSLFVEWRSSTGPFGTYSYYNRSSSPYLQYTGSYPSAPTPADEIWWSDSISGVAVTLQ